MLPFCYYRLNWKECSRSPLLVVLDFLYIFFVLKTFPDHYGPCRLWEVERGRWKYYYGSSYHPYQRLRLRKQVQRYEYQILFNDKAVCEQLCRGIGVSLPVTLGILSKEGDYRTELDAMFAGTSSHQLIVKPILGHAGMGIVLAEKTSGGKIEILWKKERTPLSGFVMKEDAIVQELLKQDSRIAAISGAAINTVRVVTLFPRNRDPVIVSATMRFSTGDAFVDNWSAGGVAVGVDCSTGKLLHYAFDKQGNRYTKHPSTGVVFEGFQIPEWQAIIDIASKVQTAFPFYRLLGMDIAINDAGVPVLIEVNANSDLIFQEQTSGPLLAIPEVRAAFSEYGLLVAKCQMELAEQATGNT